MSRDWKILKVGVLSVLGAALALTVPVSLSGCNTAEGFGEDLEAAGEGLQDEAREEKYDDDDLDD
jgi:predicted small secreted protein